jgi:hypothetical protein
MSRHHCTQVKINTATPSKNKSIEKVWNHLTIPDVIVIAAIAPVRGQGLWSTR